MKQIFWGKIFFKMMNCKNFTAIILLILYAQSQKQEECHTPNKLIYEKSGNLSITVILNGKTGINCSTDIDQGLEEIAAAIWTITALNHYHYLPGLKLGLVVYESCGRSEAAQKALLQSIVYESCSSNDSFTIGTLTTSEIAETITPLAERVNKTIVRMEHLLNTNSLLEIMIQLLTNLRWTTINRVIADSEEILQLFSMKTSDEGICVYDEVLIDNKYAANNEVLYPEDLFNEEIVSKDRPLIVIIAKSGQIESLMTELGDEIRNATGKWILLPTDGRFAMSSASVNLPENTLIILPLTEQKENLTKFIENEQIQRDFLNHKETTKSPLFLKIASGLLDLLKPFKNVQEAYCPNISPNSKDPCLQLYKMMQDVKSEETSLILPRDLEITPEKIENVLTSLKIETADNDGMFLYITSLVKNSRIEETAITQVYQLKSKSIKPTLILVQDDLLDDDYGMIKSRKKRTFKVDVDDIKEVRKQQERTKTEAPTTEMHENATSVDKKTTGERSDIDLVRHPCLEIFANEAEDNTTRNCGICQNFVKYHVKTTEKTIPEKRATTPVTNPQITWRFRIWVAINSSVATIGIICTITIAIFITVRICKGDILEGSPYFTFLLLLSVILIYSSILPYNFELVQNEESTDRSFLPICDLRIVCPALSYSIMFSIMLSRSLMLASSDQDGGFMSHVNGYLQTVLCFFMCAVQVALSSQFWLFNSYTNKSQDNEDCLEMYINHKIIVLLGYSIFLLVILMCISPFMFRSKRNYREGFFFTVAVFSVFCVWCTWIAFYFVLPLEYKDSAIAFGLTATATTILLCVFIPRSYLMVTALVRDQIANSLPPLGCTSTGNVSEINYRSNQALYDSVVSIPRHSPKTGLSNPNFYSHNSIDSPPGSPKENFYASEATLKMNASRTSSSLGSRRNNFRGSRSGTPENGYEIYDVSGSPKNVTKF